MYDNDTDFLDTFCRAYILEMVEETSYSDYQGLVRYVVHEASYDKVLLAVFDQRRFLREQDETDNDVERARRIQGIEQAVKPVLGLSIAMLAGTKKVQGPVKQAIDNLLRGKKGRLAKIAQRAHRGEGAAGIAKGGLTSMVLMPLITFLVGKIIFVTWERSRSVCRKQCKTKVGSDENHRRLRLKVCESQCKVAGYRKMIAKLRSEITKCNASENPEKCQTTLVKHVGKYNELFKREQIRLRRLTAQLNSKAAVAKRQDVTATRPPEIS
jgi:hypothetical protein